MATLVSFWLALALAFLVALKIRRFDLTASAMATYGVTARPLQRAGASLLIGVELALAALLAVGASWAAAATASLFGLFAAATAIALLAGRGGRPCACFGSASRLSWLSPLRAVALALAAAALAGGLVPSAPDGYDRWLTIALSLCVAAVGGLALALLALAREVGVLRLGAAGRGALEIPDEGPELGSPQLWAGAVKAGPRAILRLAVFSSEGCPLCRLVEPAVAHVAADPLVAVAVFDEAADALTWRQAGVPGSPYAVALSLDGIVLAKGTFNSLPQLESVLATARVRERELPVAA